MPAAYYAVSYVVTFQTIDPKLGRKVLVEIEIGGCGGLPYSDGASAHSFGMHNNANIPMEMIESDMPLTFLGYGLLPDSGGAGRHRGGLGLWREWRIDCPAAQLSTNLDRFKFRPFGLDGGEPAGAQRAHSDPRRREAGAAVEGDQHDGAQGRHRAAGDLGRRRLRLRRRRAPRELIERDVRHGYVSAEAAAPSTATRPRSRDNGSPSRRSGAFGGGIQQRRPIEDALAKACAVGG